MDENNYREERGKLSCFHKNEEFYTITPIPYYYKRRKIILKLIEEYISKDEVKKICDFGCGDGWYINFFKNKYQNKKYFGIDSSKSMIDRAKKHVEGVELSISNNGINFIEMFNLVYSIAVFAHIEDELLLSLFKNINEKLEYGGFFILFEQTAPKRVGGENWVRRNQKEYIDYANQCGFILDKKVHISFLAHNFFERRIAKIFYEYFSKGESMYHKRLYANKSALFRMLSQIFVWLSFSPIRDDESTFGNTLYFFKKKECL